MKKKKNEINNFINADPLQTVITTSDSTATNGSLINNSQLYSSSTIYIGDNIYQPPNSWTTEHIYPAPIKNSFKMQIIINEESAQEQMNLGRMSELPKQYPCLLFYDMNELSMFRNYFLLYLNDINKFNYQLKLLKNGKKEE